MPEQRGLIQKSLSLVVILTLLLPLPGPAADLMTPWYLMSV